MNLVSQQADYPKLNQTDTVIALFLQIPQGDRLEVRINKSQYHFYLNDAIVQQIQQAKEIGGDLYIPPSLLIPLWYYTCVSYNSIQADPEKKVLVKTLPVNTENTTQSSPIASIPNFYLDLISNIATFILRPETRHQLSLQAEFTFNSEYQQELVLQSTILLNGDVFHKIQKNFLENHLNCGDVISAHYWLTEQILSYFRNNLNLLVWEIASLIPASFIAYNLHSSYWLTSIAVWLSTTVGIAFSRPVLVNILQRLTTIKSQNINNWAWGIICTTSSLIIGGFQGFSSIQPLVMFFVSSLTPEIIKPILRYIWPQMGKFGMGFLSRLPF